MLGCIDVSKYLVVGLVFIDVFDWVLLVLCEFVVCYGEVFLDGVGVIIFNCLI